MADITKAFGEVKARVSGARQVRGACLQNTSTDFFVSYSRRDEMALRWVTEELASAREGIRLYVDQRQLDVGQAWQQEIYRALDACWRVLCIFSESYLKSKVFIEELNIALCRARRSGVRSSIRSMLSRPHCPRT